MIPPKPKEYTTQDPFRTPATIESGKHYFEEHVGQMTSYVFCNYDDGGTQGFGGLGLGPKGGKLERAWERDVCDLFKVKDFKQLEGKRCYVLRCFDEWSATMEGLEAEDGRRLTIRSFLKRHLPDQKEQRDPLQYKIESLESSIEMHKRRAREDFETLRTIRKRYKAWDV